MAGCGETNSISVASEMDFNVESNPVEDFDNRTSKRAKCSESSVSDDSLTSPTISTSSLVSECSESINLESDNQINDEPLPSSSTKSTLSPVSKLMNEETVSADDEKQTYSAADVKQPNVMNEETASVDDEKQPYSADDDKQPNVMNEETASADDEKQTYSTDDDKQQDEPKHIINDVTYDNLPQDYTLTEQNRYAHCVILDCKEEDILVKIDDISIKQRYLMCLLDKNKWLDDEVISAYICCLKEQALVQNQNDAKVYFENPFVTRLLKQDGESGIRGPTCMTNVVKNYLNHDMIHLPINIKDSHWYLASVNFEKFDIQVLDSLCWEHNRADLTKTLQGLQYHLDIIKSEENSSNHKLKDLDVTRWTITEQLQKPIQKDSSSCALFMLKFMEYWTGHTLSHPITQKIITSFRYKLAAILLCWKSNTAPPTTMFEESDDSDGDPN